MWAKSNQTNRDFLNIYEKIHKNVMKKEGRFVPFHQGHDKKKRRRNS